MPLHLHWDTLDDPDDPNLLVSVWGNPAHAHGQHVTYR